MATAVVGVGVATLAQLVLVSAHANRVATTTSVTLLLAERKMEELLADPGDPAGDRHHVEYLDPSGVSLGVTTSSLPPDTPPPGGTAYICRWSIEPLRGSPGAASAVQVLVTPWPDPVGQTRLVSVKTRRAL